VISFLIREGLVVLRKVWMGRSLPAEDSPRDFPGLAANAVNRVTKSGDKMGILASYAGSIPARYNLFVFANTSCYISLRLSLPPLWPDSGAREGSALGLSFRFHDSLHDTKEALALQLHPVTKNQAKKNYIR
jgi:hypothetical protein